MDLWSSRDMRSYVGITGHFIEDFKLKNVTLACCCFKGLHIAENILLNFQQVTCSFNIEKKITTIITDNAANMIKEFVTIPGFEVDNVSDSDSDEEDNEMVILSERNSFVYEPNTMDYLPKQSPALLILFNW